jgi:hypothetical protein
MKNRKFVYIPEINRETFLFFYFEIPAGRSYSFRDYSIAAGIRTTYSKQYPYTADQILAMAKYNFDAPKHSTGDIEFWRSQVLKLNHKYLSTTQTITGQSKSAIPEVDGAKSQRNSDDTADQFEAPSAVQAGPFYGPSMTHKVLFPILSINDLLAHPVKGAKTQDLERIFKSKQSEDWVTWNAFKLISLLNVNEWWPSLMELAKQDNPGLAINSDPEDQPTLQAWVRVSTPPDYERSCRARMADSNNTDSIARSKDSRPVEGFSEIDLVLTTRKHLGFIEAKLGYDVSMTTTNDSERNQIARNVDCLLESVDQRIPFFWMIVADRGHGRAYMQLMQKYKNAPSILANQLSHRREEQIENVVGNFAIVLWKDLIEIVQKRYEQIFKELQTRVSIGR